MKYLKTFEVLGDYYLGLLSNWLRLSFNEYDLAITNMYMDCYDFVYDPNVREWSREISISEYKPNSNDIKELSLIKEWIFLNLNDKLEDFESYLKDPDLYRDSNKYNL